MSSSLKILGPVTLQELCMISLVCRWYYQCGHSGEQYFPNDKKVFIDNAFVTEQLNCIFTGIVFERLCVKYSHIFPIKCKYINNAFNQKYFSSLLVH